MAIFGSLVARTKALAMRLVPPPGSLSPPGGGGWFPVVRESYPGAWQQNVEVALTDVLQHPTVYACVTLISSDIAKMPPNLVALDDDGIWMQTESAAFSPVLRKPNRYQTRIAFFKSWLISKLTRGNAYVLKQRDARQVVTALYVLDPTRVTPLIAPDGAVYYELRQDDLSSIPDTVVVPASEIIHDTMNTLYHPLVGFGPIYACGLAATLGLKVIGNSAKFFANGSQPSGILTAPGAITDVQAQDYKDRWLAGFTGDNVGRVAVLGAGLTYEPLRQTAVDSQLIDQWKASAEAICAAFHVPAYLAGAAPPPAYNNIEALQQAYYSQCLQELIEAIELLLDDGLGLGPAFGNRYGVEFDLDTLLRMDTATMVSTLAASVGAGIDSPNEARLRLNKPPVAGGETPYLQQQYWPLNQLAQRDIPPIPSAPPPAKEKEDEDEDEDDDRDPEDEDETEDEEKDIDARTAFLTSLTRKIAEDLIHV
jgi:HK97 family phage portal protein